MTLYDVLCQVRKATEIVIKCRKVSQDVAKCRKVSQNDANRRKVSQLSSPSRCPLLDFTDKGDTKWWPSIRCMFRGPKNQRKLFCTKFFNNPSGHGRPRRKSWTSAPKSAFSCVPGGGEKLFDPWASGRKGQECPREIRTKKLFMSMLFFLPWMFDSLWSGGLPKY